jgi:hypothetical protein
MCALAVAGRRFGVTPGDIVIALHVFEGRIAMLVARGGVLSGGGEMRLSRRMGP